MGFSLTWGSGVLAVLALGILIIVHEGGHFVIARLSGMRVDRFSIGFGPTLLSFRRGETIYQIAMVPLGGFVQIAGLAPGEEQMTTNDPRSYPNRPAWQRFATIFAGPATNYVFAAILMVAFHFIWGIPTAGKAPIVGGLENGKPAAVAGLQLGDEIVSIDGKAVKDMTEVAPIIGASQGRPIVVALVREGLPRTLSVTPEKIDGTNYRIGIQLVPKEETVKGPAGACIVEGLLYPINYSEFILHNFKEILTGRQEAKFSGPLGIWNVLRSQIRQGWKNTFSIVAAISVYLGLFNLLPLPALDGGRLVFLGWELISRRRVNQRVEQGVHTVGMVVLLGFILWVSLANDIGLGRLFHHGS